MTLDEVVKQKLVLPGATYEITENELVVHTPEIRQNADLFHFQGYEDFMVFHVLLGTRALSFDIPVLAAVLTYFRFDTWPIYMPPPKLNVHNEGAEVPYKDLVIGD